MHVAEEDVALIRNSTEANNNVNNGFRHFGYGEVVVWDENHGTNNRAWMLRQERSPLKVVKVNLAGVEDPQEVIRRFEDRTTCNTRILTFTEVSNESGLKVPAKELCKMARERGIHVHVDGAQSWGAFALDLEDMGCDSFSASGHKWFMGPKETGLLFMRREVVHNFLPNVYGYDYKIELPDAFPDNAQRFELLGQRDDPNLCAMLLTAELHREIGYERIEKRIVELAGLLSDKLREIGETVITPENETLTHGVVIMEVEEDKRQDLYNHMYENCRIAGSATGGLRLCPHIYNTEPHLDRVVRGIKRWRRGSE